MTPNTGTLTTFPALGALDQVADVVDVLRLEAVGPAHGELEIDAKALLARHDSYGFFSALGDLVVTGPTRTNVNDYRAILIA